MLRVADVFCGAGSFSIAAEDVGMRYVYACDIDPVVQQVYLGHFGIKPDGDINKIDPNKIPDHDILCASFPKQLFTKNGNEDRKHIVESLTNILRVKKPLAYVLEDVKGITSEERQGEFKMLCDSIISAGYSFRFQQMKCEDFGIPQSRHRIVMIGFKNGATKNSATDYKFPVPLKTCPTLGNFLGVDLEKTISNTVGSTYKKPGSGSADLSPKNWRSYKTKSGDIFEYQLTHVMKLQGLDEKDFIWPKNLSEEDKWKIVGNATPTCISRAILLSIKNYLSNITVAATTSATTQRQPTITQMMQPATCTPSIAAAAPLLVQPHLTEDCDPPRAKKPKLEVCNITIKSGTSLCLTLPDGTDIKEQTYILKIIR